MDAIECFRIAVALLYHEARHIRRLKSQSLQDANSWGMLRSLPDDRWQAWHQIRPLFIQSAKAKTPEAVETIFRNYFRKDVAALEQLFREACWPSNLGGNKWADSAMRVRRLGAAIASGDAAQIQVAFAAAKKARHNTGTLMEKYAKLESSH